MTKKKFIPNPGLLELTKSQKNKYGSKRPVSWQNLKGRPKILDLQECTNNK